MTNRDRETAKDAWMEGYRLGKNVEDVDRVSERMATDRFRRWWDREVVSDE